MGISAVAMALGVYAAFGGVTAVAYADGTTSADASSDGSASKPAAAGDTEGAVRALEPDRVLLLPDGDEDLWSEDYADLVSLA